MELIVTALNDVVIYLESRELDNLESRTIEGNVLWAETGCEKKAVLSLDRRHCKNRVEETADLLSVYISPGLYAELKASGTARYEDKNCSIYVTDTTR